MQDEFLRYSCQLALPGFTEATQQNLQQAKVLIVGAGGLGCPAAQYLAAAGIGTIGVADADTIGTSNLHRQVLYTPAEVGLKKASITCMKLEQQNPGITLVPHDIRVTSENVMDLTSAYDLVLDCTDNFETKYLLNDACVLSGKPLIYGAIYQYEGQVAVWNVLNKDESRSPNYRDLFPTVNAGHIPNCAEGGVMPTLAGIIGCMQANEAIKYFTRQKDLLAGTILIFDAQTMQSRLIKIGTVTKTSITALRATVAEPVIAAKELKENFHKNVYELIDVRTREEHDLFNIGGKNLPVNELDGYDAPVENTRPVVLYCSSGSRSGEAVKLLRNKFPGMLFFSLEGGLKAWEKQT